MMRNTHPVYVFTASLKRSCKDFGTLKISVTRIVMMWRLLNPDSIRPGNAGVISRYRDGTFGRLAARPRKRV